MGEVLVVDGSDVCRAPIAEFALLKQFAGDGPLDGTVIASRGLAAERAAGICQVAADRIGVAPRAATFSLLHAAEVLAPEDLLAADLVLTADRAHRSAVVQLAPEVRDRAFTLKEALVLATVLADEVRAGSSPRPRALPEVVAQLHEVRGCIPLIEPPMHTSVFHRDRALPDRDPLALVDGHGDAALHRHATDETYQVALTLGSRLVDLTEDRMARVGAPGNDWFWRQRA